MPKTRSIARANLPALACPRRPPGLARLERGGDGPSPLSSPEARALRERTGPSTSGLWSSPIPSGRGNRPACQPGLADPAWHLGVLHIFARDLCPRSSPPARPRLASSPLSLRRRAWPRPLVGIDPLGRLLECPRDRREYLGVLGSEPLVRGKSDAGCGAAHDVETGLSSQPTLTSPMPAAARCFSTSCWLSMTMAGR
jgi:hypothetical protein